MNETVGYIVNNIISLNKRNDVMEAAIKNYGREFKRHKKNTTIMLLGSIIFCMSIERSRRECIKQKDKIAALETKIAELEEQVGISREE